MTPFLSLPCGWSLARDAASGRPWFKRRGHAITPREMAGLPEARGVFREVKRALDVRDMKGARTDDMDWRALDMAKFSLQLALQDQQRFSHELLETGVV